uniref:Mitochondrial cardiolipin hydrolase n=1 Tax=Phytophthora ramorum TaxID=164328 RepID=H3GSE3_PHYRM
MGRRAGVRNTTHETRQAMVRAVQQRLLQTGKKDIKAVSEEHDWNRRTVAHYYAMYERGESLQPRCGIVVPLEQAGQPARLPAPVGQDTRPAARARGVASVEQETWFTRDADAEDKFMHYLGLAARPHGSLDICNRSIANDHIGETILKALAEGCVVRMIVDEQSALQQKNMAWVRKFKDAGIPIKTGREASFRVNNNWMIVNGEFILQGMSNYSTDAFDRARHAAMFKTITAQVHLDSTKREFELLWEEGRVLQWVSRRTACVMQLGEDENESKYPPGEDE